ncbi:MAG: fatty acid desaturase [Natronospirillum sp.]|uniref:fatty acid desaturase n=1 Tax=Natronospirillum sp. TaxID=2812955 RepID=UPI0025EA8B06|nr:fatty acid desaturase [Natronospirillum sp.]MCH8550855.1 fatty acid desaturase [Natronospirillum sp.]
MHSLTEFQATINDQTISVGDRETVLEAALREGLPFPHSCRVGGCASCKCQLTSGQVRELTESGYLLSGPELASGHILACQSVARSDLTIRVELPERVAGRVTAQQALTPRIMRLVVQLEATFDYQAGQYAQLELASLPGVVRPYSFATSPQADGQVVFLVQHEPEGQFSGVVHSRDLVGKSVTLTGPLGQFQLQPGTAPLLFFATGSGLAPILAILHQALAAGEQRPVTLVLGARHLEDLFALEELDELARAWPAEMRIVPVLSAPRVADHWSGARGRITDHIPDTIVPDTQAYCCGSPAMVDQVAALLAQKGVDEDNIHVDRFTPQPGAAAEDASRGDDAETVQGAKTASVWHYLKFALFHVVGVVALLSILAGGAAVSFGLLAILVFYVAGDALSGNDTSRPIYRYPFLLTLQLWLALPLLALIVFAAVWQISPGDPLGFGQVLTQLTGYDLLVAKAATAPGHWVSMWLLTGLMIGMIGTITAHELTHRTWDKASLCIGRWLLAFSFDTAFSIEHVYGHHRYVATREDPATAPRGRHVYHHMVASTWTGNLSAWRIERARLKRRGYRLFGHHNAVLRGYAMSLCLLAAAWALGGWVGAVFFTLAALWGKALLEVVNYMEHYGLVRNATTPVQPRHSWNTNKRLSSWSLFNLTRHSHHHAQGEAPFHELSAYPNAPMMISGYLSTILVALIPPLWHQLMTPRLLAWDEHFANEEERKLAAEANASSGVARLVRASIRQ